MRNKYRAKCWICHKWVLPDGGQCNKVHGVWRTTHDECDAQSKSPWPDVPLMAEEGPKGRQKSDVIEYHGPSQQKLFEEVK